MYTKMADILSVDEVLAGHALAQAAEMASAYSQTGIPTGSGVSLQSDRHSYRKWRQSTVRQALLQEMAAVWLFC
jgi:hypothetical protein